MQRLKIKQLNLVTANIYSEPCCDDVCIVSYFIDSYYYVHTCTHIHVLGVKELE